MDNKTGIKIVDVMGNTVYLKIPTNRKTYKGIRHSKFLKGHSGVIVRPRPRTVGTINRILGAAKANLAVEGFKFTTEEENLAKARLRGEMSHQEYLKRVLEMK